MRNKVILSVILMCIFLVLLPSILFQVNFSKSAKMIENLSGEIYYTKELAGSLALYKSDANLKQEKLIYSNIGKGKLDVGFSNDNIGDFRFFSKKQEIEFEAVYNGKWRILSLKSNETVPRYVRAPKEEKVLEDFRAVQVDTDYLPHKIGNIEVYDKKGSLYIKSAGQEKCIKKFIGAYSEKFTGYRVVGLTPDQKYLIYSDLGMLLGTLINDKKQYIMDLQTGKSASYLDFSHYIQWVEK
jgi:hypothetical protein